MPKIRIITAYIIAIAGVGIALTVSLLLRPILSETPTLLFIVAITVVAWLAGLYPSLLASVLAATSINYFFLRPHFSMTFDSESLLRAGVFLLVSVVVSSLTASQRRSSIELRSAHDMLERRVVERTSELANANEKLQVRATQRATVVALGEQALVGSDIGSLMSTAARSVSQTLGTDFCQIWEYKPQEGALSLWSAVGIERDDKETLALKPDEASYGADVLASGTPVVFNSVPNSESLNLPSSLSGSGAVSGVIIGVRGYRTFGVLETCTRVSRDFTKEDISYLQTVVNILATAIDRKEAEAVLEQQTFTLVQTLSTLVEDMNLEAFLDLAAASLKESLHANSTTIWLFESANHRLIRHKHQVDTLISHEDEYLGLGQPADVQVDEADIYWRQILTDRQPIIVKRAPRANETDLPSKLCNSTGDNSCEASLLVPMLLGKEPIGLFCVGFSAYRPLRSEELDLSQAIAQQATLAVHLMQLAGQAQDAAVLDERNRMAREIHDTLAQGLTGIIIHLEAADCAMKGSPDRVQHHIDEAKSTARQSLAEARTSVWALRPLALEQTTLPRALAKMANEMSTGVTEVDFHLVGNVWPLPLDIQHNLLRIAQESVTNAIRHSHAARIHIELQYRSEDVTLHIKDDGCGFDAANSMPGFGLKGIRERAEQMGSSAEIVSTVGEGTTINILVKPIQLKH